MKSETIDFDHHMQGYLLQLDLQFLGITESSHVDFYIGPLFSLPTHHHHIYIYIIYIYINLGMGRPKVTSWAYLPFVHPMRWNPLEAHVT